MHRSRTREKHSDMSTLRSASLADSKPSRGRAGDDDAEPEPARPTARPATRRSKLRIELGWDAPDVDPPAAGWLEPRLAGLAGEAGVASGELSLLVIDDQRMAGMHERHTGVAGTTDVLTFDLLPAAPAPRDASLMIVRVEGDLLLCRDEAIRQAAARGHSPREELLLYALHGLLHLLGHDDHDPGRAAAMHRREDALLRASGLAPVYHR